MSIIFGVSIAERATSARDGVDVCIEMVETWGYAPSGRAYTMRIRPKRGSVQIVCGKYYVAVRCPDDAVIVMPNHYTVHSLNMEGFVRGENILYPDDLIDYAKEKGFYEETDGEFDFARASRLKAPIAAMAILIASSTARSCCSTACSPALAMTTRNIPSM